MILMYTTIWELHIFEFGEMQNAVRMYEKSIKLDDSNDNTYSNLGYSYIELLNFKKDR